MMHHVSQKTTSISWMVRHIDYLKQLFEGVQHILSVLKLSAATAIRLCSRNSTDASNDEYILACQKDPRSPISSLLQNIEVYVFEPKSRGNYVYSCVSNSLDSFTYSNLRYLNEIRNVEKR
jgi:hypothetical protein